MTLRAFILAPEIIFAAEVAANPADSAYPIDQVTFDTVTVGAFGDIKPGQMVTFGVNANHGVQRIRKAATADTIYIGRTSKGYGYSEVFLFGDSQINVWDLRTVWTKPPFIDIDIADTSQAIYKDGDIVYSDQTIEPPPVANTGPGTMATIATGIITVEFDGTNSFAVADGATISSYLWDVGDGTITVGTSASATITATFPAGFRYISLTVTDSNAKVHTAYCPVFARDPAADVTIPIDGLTIRRGQEGQEATVQLTRPLPESTYPDNTLVMLADGEPSSAGDRSHMEFIGWHHRDAADHRAERTGYITGAQLTCLDVAGKMQVVHGFSQEISHAATPSHWGEMATANMDKLMHYLLQWHSNALELADWTWSGTGATYALIRRGANPGTLWEQVKTQAEEMNPTYRLTCNSLGQLAVIVDPMVVASISRTSTVQAAISEADWSNIRYDHERYPRYYWLRGGAVRAGNELNSDGEIDLIFCISPGTAPGIGYTEMRDEVGIAPTQAILNTTYGHRYARMNAPERPFRITLPGGSDIEPAAMTWVTVTVGQDAVSAPRGLSLSAARGLPLELTKRWAVTRTGTVKSAELLWERETIGSDAVTVIPQANENEVDTGLPDDYFDDTGGGIIELPTSPFYGDPLMYVLWDGAHVLRTADIMPASPTWEIVATKDTDFTGFIMDGRYVIKADDTVGMWLLTTLGAYWCDDIMATTPVWEEKLTNATIQATEPTPPVGVLVVKCMATYAQEPGYMIVATGPLAANFNNLDYQNAGFWHTHDFGDNWEYASGGPMYTQGPNTSGFMYTAPFAMEMSRSSPTIYCLRNSPRYGANMRRIVLVSEDGGHTWDDRFYDFESASTVFDEYSLLHPFPSATDASYVVIGDTGVSDMPDLWISRNEWDDLAIQLTALDDPTGYGGVVPLWRVNKKTDPQHVMAWFRDLTASKNIQLLESYDYGATWSLLWTPLVGTQTLAAITHTNTGASGNANGSTYNTPNGWPADDDVFFIVRARGDALITDDDIIQITTDNFATVESRLGNISTLLGGVWVESPNSGFCLPKIGVNT